MEMKIFAKLNIHVGQMKEIVTLMMNVRMVFSVDQIIVQTLLAFILNLIAVMTHLLNGLLVNQEMILINAGIIAYNGETGKFP